MKTFVLDNGMKVVAEPMPHYRSVSIGIWVRSGSRFESESENGISHLVEHMLFKGTDKYDTKEMAALFDRIGGHVNAYTEKEYTCYYAKVLDEHVDIALDLLSGMYYHPRMDSGDLENEKQVIIEEIAMYEDTPDELVHDLAADASFGQHPLAYPVLGSEDQLVQFETDDLMRYMNRFYVPGQTVISLAGHIDDRCLERVRHYFDRPAAQSPPARPNKPVHQPGYVFRRKDAEQNHICLVWPGISLHDERQYTLAVLNQIIGGGMSSRLFQNIRESRGLAYSVYSYPVSYTDCGQLIIYLGTAPRTTGEGLNVLADTIRQLASDGVHEQEWNAAVEQLKADLIMSMESTSRRMHRIGKQELLLKQQESYETAISQLIAVRPRDVDELLQHLFAQPFALAAVGASDKEIQRFKEEYSCLILSKSSD